MKKTKFAVLFAALIAVLGLSSCLGEPDPYSTVDGIFKHDGFIGDYKFQSPYGITIRPTNQAIITEGLDYDKFVYIVYKYDNRDLGQGVKNIDAELQGAPYQIENMGMYEQVGNAPLVYNEKIKGISYFPVIYDAPFYGKEHVFLSFPIAVKYDKTDKDKNDLSAHHLYIYKDNEISEKGTENDLILRVAHIVDDVEIENSETEIVYEHRHVNLSYFLNGTTPEKIIIKYQVAKQSNSSNGDEEVELVDSENPFVIEYSKLFPETPQQ